MTVSSLDTEEKSADSLLVTSLIKAHVHHTGSEWGQHILDNFEHFVLKFRVVDPKQVISNNTADTVPLKVVV